MNKNSKTENYLNLRIVTLQGIKYENTIHSVQVNLKDGLMIINKNYSNVIENLASGKIKIFLNHNKKYETLYVGEGWMIVNHNKCELLVSDFKKN